MVCRPSHRPSPVSDVHSVSWLFGKRRRDYSQRVAFFRPPGGVLLLKPRSLLRRYPWKMWYPVKQEALLISDWQRKCPRPMVHVKPVTQPADGGEGATPYCWSWRLDFLFLARRRADCIMRWGREVS